jgi:hypothetical protein
LESKESIVDREPAADPARVAGEGTAE